MPDSGDDSGSTDGSMVDGGDAGGDGGTSPNITPKRPFNVDTSTPQLTVHQITPSDTDSSVVLSTDEERAVVDTRVPLTGKLVVFLMGANNHPTQFAAMHEELAARGYHVLAPDYFNVYENGKYKALCDAGDGDDDCHDKLRLETWDGQDRSAHIAVSAADSVSGRISALLRYLDTNDAKHAWGHFLNTDDEPLWQNMIFAGISYGSDQAAHVAIHQEIDRVVMFSGPFDHTNNEPASWMSKSKQTPLGKFHSFRHIDDQQSPGQQNALQRLGLTEETSVDGASPPYGNARRLRTDATVGSGMWDAHLSVVAGSWSPKDGGGNYVFAPVWNYLFPTP